MCAFVGIQFFCCWWCVCVWVSVLEVAEPVVVSTSHLLAIQSTGFLSLDSCVLHFIVSNVVIFTNEHMAIEWDEKKSHKTEHTRKNIIQKNTSGWTNARVFDWCDWYSYRAARFTFYPTFFAYLQTQLQFNDFVEMLEETLVSIQCLSWSGMPNCFRV